nr:uncharacterized protein CI109_002421 [Kwoniella shandongensis]KAA5529080.1 hypothetical protein CI109_002421 [Kwoniella shandongensis]
MPSAFTPSPSPNPRRNDARRIKFGIWICSLIIVGAGTSTLIWISLVFVLVYAIPFLVYLLLAQTDPPSHVKGLFLPLNPVRNFGITLATFQYLFFLLNTLPRVAVVAFRYVIWHNLLKKLDEENVQRERTTLDRAQPIPVKVGVRVGRETRVWKGKGKADQNAEEEEDEQQWEASLVVDELEEKEEEEGTEDSYGDKRYRGEGIFRDFAVYNVEYRLRKDARSALLDIYLPRCSKEDHLAEQNELEDPQDTAAAFGTTRSRAPDIDNDLADESSKSAPVSESDPMPRSSTNKDKKTRKRSIKGSGRPVVVFIYDVGALGVLKPRKEMFCLVGAKFAEMGYVTVVPDITLYPDGEVEEMVTDLRYVLSWVEREISKYDGIPSRIFLVGHGLGAHLAMYTLAQDAVVRSRDARQATLESKRQNEVVAKLNGTPMGRWKGRMDEDLPNGLRALSIYAEDVKLPTIKGIILLAPVSDIIKQIRFESKHWLEHISPIRRAHGLSQIMCMQHSLGHLLFAAKNVLQPERLPRRVMIVHGAQDRIVPFDSAHWLSELLYGLDVPTVFRPYRNLGHYDLLISIMKGFNSEYTEWLERDFRAFIET